MRARRLALRGETLTELAPGDLTLVAGGGDTTFNCNTGFTVCGICDFAIERPPIPTEHRSGC